MSIPLAKVYEPNANARNPDDYIALVGGIDKTTVIFRSESVTNTSASFPACNPPSESHLVDRKVYFRARFRIRFTGNSTTGNLLKKGRDGLRFMPLSSIIFDLRTTINSQSVNCNLSDTIHARSRYWKQGVNQRSQTTSASGVIDNVQNYSDSFGITNSPLSGFGDSGLTSGQGRGCITDLEIISNTPTGAEVRFTVFEPAILAPFIHDENSCVGTLWRVNTLAFDLQFENINRIWCHDRASAGTITAMDTTLENMECFVTFITPPRGLDVPPVCVVPYDQWNRLETDVGVMNPNEEKIVTTSVYQFQQVPQSVYLFCKPSRNAIVGSLVETIGTSDTFTQISNISINFNNRNQLLSNVTSEQLFKISVENGLNMDYQNFRGVIQGTFDGPRVGLSGSVIKLLFGKDIAGEEIIPGLGGAKGRCNFQLQATVKNINQTRALPYTFYVVPCYEGYMTISNQSNVTCIAPINEVEDVIASPESRVTFNDYNETMGGSLWDWIKKAHNWVKDNKVVSTAMSMIPQTRAFAPVAASMGYGTGGACMAAGTGGAISAAGVYGGRSLTTAQLKKLRGMK